MTDDPLYTDPDLVAFYDWENPWAASDDFFCGFARAGDRVLDLGCGTGMLAVELARRGHGVTGLDPAGAMLDVARGRGGGALVEWVQGDARTFDLGAVFDCILMTGHAFQTLLTPADRLAVMACVARHMAPGGRFVFDSRNPLCREWEEWTPDQSLETLEHPDLGPVERWNDVAVEAGRVTYGTHYRVRGRVLSAQSPIAFPSQAEIEEGIATAGLSVQRWLGGYGDVEWSKACAEIIPVVGHAGQ